MTQQSSNGISKTTKAILILLALPLTAALSLGLAWSTDVAMAWGSESVIFTPVNYLIAGAIAIVVEVVWLINTLRSK
ncbi:MAG: hypothetical protein Q8Q11_03895 [bacterium]|nr:hypothetical protein [bacterium]MDZ4248042.1 hypothetical protein [Patescibacteria group bacterium]